MDGTLRNRLARLSHDGSLDLEFDPPPRAAPHLLAAPPDGRVLVGNATQKSDAEIEIRRLLSNGLFDSNFTPTQIENGINAAIAQEDGRILIAGGFHRVNGAPREGIIRLKPDGTLDPEFNPVLSETYSTIYDAALQADGKILLGGNFTSIDGIPRRSIARLNKDGSVDATFNPLVGSPAPYEVNVLAVTIQEDGKLIV